MRVSDIMQPDPIHVRPGATVSEAARLMVARRVSGLPVVDDRGAVVGVVSEGDFLARAEFREDSPRSWWLGLISDGASAESYVKAHGQKVSDVMSKPVATIAPEASVAAAARMMEQKGVKRLPVVADGGMVGIVSRADIVRALASMQPEAAPPPATDAEIRQSVLDAFKSEPALRDCQVTVIVQNGKVELWGLANDENGVQAAGVAAAKVAGDGVSIENHIARFPTAYYG